MYKGAFSQLLLQLSCILNACLFKIMYRVPWEAVIHIAALLKIPPQVSFAILVWQFINSCNTNKFSHTTQYPKCSKDRKH